MNLLQNKLPASQYDTDKVIEADEEHYEDDFENLENENF